MDLRVYSPADRKACLAVFNSHPAMAADSAERETFERFLQLPTPTFFVLEHEAKIVACGGYDVNSEGLAHLQWGMVRADFQKLGLGRFLLMFRLREIGKRDDVPAVTALVPLTAQGFFEKQGFKFTGFHTARAQMLKKLTVCA